MDRTLVAMVARGLPKFGLMRVSKWGRPLSSCECVMMIIMMMVTMMMVVVVVVV